MTVNPDILIGSADAQHVLIRPIARLQPGLFDDRDANWIACEVQVAAGPFHGALPVDLPLDQLTIFLDDIGALDAMAAAVATFTNGGGQLSISLARADAGPIEASGDIIDPDGSTRLQFAFSIDADDLRESRRGLEQLLAAYPVVRAAGA